MRWILILILGFFAFGGPLSARWVEVDDDALNLTRRAAAQDDGLTPAPVGLAAVIGLAAVSLLSLFSVGEHAPGAESALERVVGAAQRDDLYLQTRVLRATHEGEAAGAYLRRIQRRSVILFSESPFAPREGLTLTVKPDDASATTFRGVVVSCRPGGDGSAWFAVRVRVLGDERDKAGVRAVRVAVIPEGAAPA